MTKNLPNPYMKPLTKFIVGISVQFATFNYLRDTGTLPIWVGYGHILVPMVGADLCPGQPGPWPRA
jgi:hypothetical protein